MTAYKLVVVDPFDNYKRGDQILDQNIVKNILNTEHDMHSYDRHVRRVSLSKEEMLALNDKSNHEMPKKEIEEDATIKIESVNDNAF